MTTNAAGEQIQYQGVLYRNVYANLNQRSVMSIRIVLIISDTYTHSYLF